MRIRLLIGHYQESYPGEHAPTVFAAADEFLLEENPSWWTETVDLEKRKTGDGVTAWAEVDLEVSTDDLLKVLHPQPPILDVDVVSDTVGTAG